MVLAAAAAAPSAAEEPSPLPPGAACELHIWPAPELKAVTQGWVWNHTVNQAFDPAKGGVVRPKVLAPDAQAALLRDLDLPTLFDKAPAAVVIHPDPLPRAEMASKERHAPSPSPCYSELIVSQMFYADAPMAGRSLRTLFSFRDFGDAPLVRSAFSTWGETDLVTFPAKTAAESEAADREIAQAYSSNVNVFANFERLPRLAPRKPKKDR